MRTTTKLLTLLALFMTVATGAWAQGAKHLITATYDKQTRSLEQPLPYATTIGELYEAVTGESFSDLISSMSAVGMPLTGIGSNNTSVVSIGELNGASTPVTVKADGKATVILHFGNFAQGIFVSVTPPLYVTMKDGVKDADKWTAKVGEGQAQALPIGELKGDGSETVTLQYTGRLKVKGVTATSEAAAPSVPDGALSGVFSVSDTKQVYFSKGNLQATYNGSNWSWAFAEHQWDYIGNAAGNTKVTESSPYISENATVDLFGWVGAACAWTGAAQYGISNEKAAAQYGNVAGEALKSDWGTLAITNGGNTANFGWHSLASSEWEYLFQTRTTPSGVSYAHATVNDVPGLVLLPDDWSTDYYSLNKVNNATGTAYTDNVISSSDWTSKLEAHGAVFLPAGGYRNGAEVSDAGVQGTYWSSTSSTTAQSARCFFFRSAQFAGVTQNYMRPRGCSVRLVREVATSDAAQSAKPAATVTTAPTGAAIVGRLNTNTMALVSGGVADGGTLMYAVTTTNTKPTSTAGFSDAVPTAQTITASGKVYVWYYVKADDTHSDSEIAATAIEVPVADIVWDVTNVSDLYVDGSGESYEKEGVTLSPNADLIVAGWNDSGHPESDGIYFEAYETGGFTFTAPTGKAFTKIEMKVQGPSDWNEANLGTGWAFNNSTVTWKGTAAASTVDLLKDTDYFEGALVKSIVFYLSE